MSLLALLTLAAAMESAGPSVTLQNLPERISGVYALSVIASDITLAANDLECGILHVEFFVNGKSLVVLGLPNELMDVSADGNRVLRGRYIYGWDTRTVPDGTYEIRVKAWDRSDGPAMIPGCNSKAPNESLPRIQSVIVDNIPDPPEPPPPVPDTVAPVVSFKTPNNTSFSSNSKEIQLIAGDDVGVDSCAITINGSGWVLSADVDTGRLPSTVSMKMAKSVIPKATYILNAVCKDAAGNSGSAPPISVIRK